MNFSHCGKLGDMFLCIPVFSYAYKTTGEKSNVYLAKFPFVESAVEILKLQECIGEVKILDYVPNDYSCGGQPYKFPIDVPDCKQLGFRGYPDKPFAKFAAEEHGLDMDMDFTLNLGEFDEPEYDTVVFDEYSRTPLKNKGILGTYMSLNDSLLSNVRKAKVAKNVIAFTTGPAVLITMARIPCTLWTDYEPNEFIQKLFVINGGFQIHKV